MNYNCLEFRSKLVLRPAFRN